MFRDPSTAAPARWRRRASRARERRTRGGGARSLGEPQTQVCRGEKRLDEISFALDRLAAAFLAIHHRQHTEHVPSLAFHRADRLARRSARGEDVLDNDDGEARREAPFDALTGPVVLRLLTHGKRVQLLSAAARGQRERIGDGIGAKSETVDGAVAPAPDGQALTPEPADHGETITGHRGEAGVDVERGPAAGGGTETPRLNEPGRRRTLERIPKNGKTAGKG